MTTVSLMFITLILLVLGLYLLAKGSDTLVDGSASIARYLNIPSIVIGLTIIAFGTSTPEFVVSLTSAFAGSSQLALSSVIGSNISNTLLILGISGIISPIIVQKNTIWKEIPLSLAAAVVLGLLALNRFLTTGNFDWKIINSNTPVDSLNFVSGMILLIFFAIFLYYTFGISRLSGSENLKIKQISIKWSLLYVLGGLIMLGVGSSFVVNSAITIASALGVSQKLIGLTLVALGTSLPELFTSINASLKKQSNLVVGNVVGSNIFNIFLILGVVPFAGKIPIVGYDVIDLGVLFIATLFLFISIFIFSKHILGKTEATFMLGFYSLYLVYIFLRG